MGKTCLCRASAAILLVASLVQLAAIASPGWTIFIEGNTETYHSVFYIMKCSTQGEYSCEFTTQAELYEEKKAVLDRHDATNNKFVRHVKDGKIALLLQHNLMHVMDMPVRKQNKTTKKEKEKKRTLIA